MKHTFTVLQCGVFRIRLSLGYWVCVGRAVGPCTWKSCGSRRLFLNVCAIKKNNDSLSLWDGKTSQARYKSPFSICFSVFYRYYPFILVPSWGKCQEWLSCIIIVFSCVQLGNLELRNNWLVLVLVSLKFLKKLFCFWSFW